MTSDVKATEESEVLIEICKEHESYFEYYIDIQKTLINIYKD
jgi:hypothetical protein